MPRIKGCSYTARSHKKKVARTGAPLPIWAADAIEDQENVAPLHVLYARDVATVQMLQDLSSQSNISQEDLVTSLCLQLKKQPGHAAPFEEEDGGISNGAQEKC